MFRRHRCLFFFFFNDTATTEIYTLSLHDALPISLWQLLPRLRERPDREGRQAQRPSLDASAALAVRAARDPGRARAPRRTGTGLAARGAGARGPGESRTHPQRREAAPGARLGGARREPADPARETGGPPRELVRVVHLPGQRDRPLRRTRARDPRVPERDRARGNGRGTPLRGHPQRRPVTGGPEPPRAGRALLPRRGPGPGRRRARAPRDSRRGRRRALPRALRPRRLPRPAGEGRAHGGVSATALRRPSALRAAGA